MAGPSPKMAGIDLKKLQADPKAFREMLVIDTSEGYRRLGDVMDDWQRADYEALDDGWENVAHRNKPTAKRRAWLERPRGHDKTSGIATMASWVLFASRRQIKGNVLASDKEQAALVREAIDVLVNCNPWLGTFLDVQIRRVKNKFTNSEMTILSSDEGGLYGQKPDFVICDEVTHWVGKKGSNSWRAVFSSIAKKKHCMFVVITNAGVGQGKSWQWKRREDARASDDWYFSRIDGPRASWITPANLEEQRRMLPLQAYVRLWENRWVTESGDALDPEVVESCVTIDGPRLVESGMLFVGGLDLGVKHDHAAFVTLGVVPGRDRVRLIECESWAPPIGGEVDLDQVEKAVAECFGRYGHIWIGYDPAQAVQMSQRLRKLGQPMVEWTFTAKNLDLMARELLRSTRNRMIELYDDPLLLTDLQRLSIVQRKYGFKLEATSDETGHADRATALTIALPAALEVAVAEPEVEDPDEDVEWRVVT